MMGAGADAALRQLASPTTPSKGGDCEVAMVRAVVGRDTELDRLNQLIEAAPEGGDALVVIGDPGIGKSTLLHAVVDRARAEGFFVLTTTGVESEAELAYAGLHELLRPALDVAAGMPQTQRGALFRAFGLEVGSQPDLFLVALATLNLLADLAASRPVLVAVDDLQWLDEPTQAALAFVARRISGDSIVVVGTTRRGFSGPYHSAGLEELDVSELSESAASALLEGSAPELSRADREAILRVARGNPLALLELPAEWRAQDSSRTEMTLTLTARLERAFAGRLSELPQPTRDTLLIAAVDGSDDLGEILLAASELAGGETKVDALESAALAGLLRFDEVRVQFRHPLVRSAVLQSETVARRQAAHAALAGVVRGEPYRRAWHRALAVTGPDDDVADELEANYRTTLQRGSVVSAIWALERSAQLTTDPSRRARRLLLAAEYAFDLGRRDKVDQLLASASQLPLSDLDRARMEWLREIFDDGIPGDAGRVVELCAMAEQSTDAGDDDLALNLLLGAALRCYWADTGPEARALVVKVANEHTGRRSDARYTDILATAEPILQAGPVRDALEHVVLESVTDADSLRLLGQAAHAIGDPLHAVDFLGRAELKLRQEGRLSLLSHVLNMQILDHLELGNWDRAAAAEAEARLHAHETGQPIWETAIVTLAAIGAGLRGDNGRAQAIAGEADRTASGRRLNSLLALIQLARGIGSLTAGNYEESFDTLRLVFDPADPSYHSVERFHAVMFLAEAAVHAGHVERARPLLTTLEQDALITPSPTLHVQLSYARAVLADDTDAESLYLAALRQDLVRWPWARARIELAYGTWLRRQRRVAESRSPLRAAHTTLNLIGATTWAERARIELRAAGERSTESVQAVHELLSPQEMQIARLAADGLSNREIGERLFLSHRTVGSHLYRIFPKLGITTRGQISGRLVSA
jgi:DNA-binding CsgD family transcriptional regulator/tetratricopeptide (TPR) repeat protein